MQCGIDCKFVGTKYRAYIYFELYLTHGTPWTSNAIRYILRTFLLRGKN
jgi:hypothetical protein